MARLDLLAVVDDPAHARRRRVVLTDRGADLAREARSLLADLEREFGGERAAACRAALADFAD